MKNEWRMKKEEEEEEVQVGNGYRGRSRGMEEYERKPNFFLFFSFLSSPFSSIARQRRCRAKKFKEPKIQRTKKSKNQKLKEPKRPKTKKTRNKTLRDSVNKQDET